MLQFNSIFGNENEAYSHQEQMDVVKEKLEVVEWKVEEGLFPIIYSSLSLRGVKCSDHFCCLFVVRWMA